MLNNIGLPGLLLIAVVVLVLFGRGKISSLMGEVGKGITAFKKGVNDSSKELEKTHPADKQTCGFTGAGHRRHFMVWRHNHSASVYHADGIDCACACALAVGLFAGTSVIFSISA